MHRLTHWILAAAAFAGAVAIAVTGPGWQCLLAALHVPAVLAVMLLTRAAVRLLRGRPFGLQIAGRTALTGKAGLWLPALVLLCQGPQVGAAAAAEFIVESLRPCRLAGPP